MVSSVMTSSTALANRAPFTARPVPCRGVAPQRARVVTAAAKADNEWKPEQAPGKAVMRAVGALAAVQLAFMPVAGAEGIKDLLPDSATSSSARAAVNERTSNLPSFTDVGESLKNALGTSGDPKDIGRAIDRNTPDGPDLTKNPKDLVQDAKQGANQLASKVQNAAPDLSAVDGPKTDRTGLPNPFDKGSGGIPRASDITELAGRARKEAGANLGGDVAKNAPTAGDVKNVGQGIASKAKGAAKKVQNAVGDNAGLPSPQEAADKVKGAVNEVGRKAGGLGDNNPLSGNVPNPSEAGDKLKGKVNEAGRKAQNAVGDNAGLPSPQEAADKLKGAANEVGRKTNNPLSGGISLPGAGEAGDKLKGKANEAGRKAQNAVPDNAGLPSPQEAANKVKGAAKEVGRKAGGLGDNNPLSGSIPDPREAGDKLKGKGNEAGRKAQNVIPNNADLPNPADAFTKVKDAVSGAGSGGSNPVGDNLQNKASEIGSKAAQFPGASTAEGKGNATGGPSEIADKMETFKAKVRGEASGLGGKVRGEEKQ